MNFTPTLWSYFTFKILHMSGCNKISRTLDICPIHCKFWDNHSAFLNFKPPLWSYFPRSRFCICLVAIYLVGRLSFTKLISCCWKIYVPSWISLLHFDLIFTDKILHISGCKKTSRTLLICPINWMFLDNLSAFMNFTPPCTLIQYALLGSPEVVLYGRVEYRRTNLHRGFFLSILLLRRWTKLPSNWCLCRGMNASMLISLTISRITASDLRIIYMFTFFEILVFLCGTLMTCFSLFSCLSVRLAVIFLHVWWCPLVNFETFCGDWSKLELTYTYTYELYTWMLLDKKHGRELCLTNESKQNKNLKLRIFHFFLRVSFSG